MALIELDLTAPPEPVRALPPAHRYRSPGLLVAALLAVALGGAAPATSVLFRPLGTARLAVGDTYQITGGRFYAFHVAGAVLTTTAWAIGPFRRLWRTTSRIVPAGDTGEPTDPGIGWLLTATAGDGVLLQSELDARILDARTGATRWRTRGVVEVLAGGRIGLVRDERFAPGPDVDPEDGVDLPAETGIRAYDLVTGRVRWTAGFRGGVRTVPSGDSLVVLDRGALTRLDAATGTVRGRRPLTGRQDVGDQAEQADGLVVVRRAERIAAYRADTLAPLWSRPREWAEQDSPPDCGDVICRLDADGEVSVLDPADGSPSWSIGPASSLTAGGDEVLETANRISRPLRLRDRRSGATRVSLTDWDWLAASTGHRVRVLVRAEGAYAIFAALSPDNRIQPLGSARLPITQCSAESALLACRTSAGVALWSYFAG